MNKIDLNFQNNSGDNIISLMIKNGNYSKVNELIKFKDKTGQMLINPNIWCNGYSYLHLICKNINKIYFYSFYNKTL